MRQHESYDFDALEPEGSGRGGRIVLSLMFLTTLAVTAGVGYGLGRGAWAIPAAVAEQIPAPLASWLPRPAQSSEAETSRSDLKDYAFELVKREMKQGSAIIDVRLVDKRSGQPVPDAVVFARRIDMAPDGMPTMTAPLESLPSPQRGLHRFETDLTMEGGWRLSLAAKVQGESGTVRDRLVLKAVP